MEDIMSENESMPAVITWIFMFTSIGMISAVLVALWRGVRLHVIATIVGFMGLAFLIPFVVFANGASGLLGEGATLNFVMAINNVTGGSPWYFALAGVLACVAGMLWGASLVAPKKAIGDLVTLLAQRQLSSTSS